LDFKVRQDTYNPLLKRKEVHVEVDHEGEGTPSRVDVRKAVASKFNTKPENVYVLDIETNTGTQSALCAIEVYDDPQSAQRTVPKYIQVRNLPPEERKRVREEQAKKEEAKPKAEKPKAEKAKPEKPKEEPKEAKEEKPKQEAKPATEPPKKAKGSEAK
jgi:small subunit ribosomal protein S24e